MVVRDRYEARGVSSSKAGVDRATQRLAQGEYPGAFCKLFAHPRSRRRLQLVHVDGVGTKVVVAYLMIREHCGNPQDLLRGLAQDCMVMNIDDAACVGALGPHLFVDMVSRHSRLIDDGWLPHLFDGFHDVAELFTHHGIKTTIAGGETADVPNLVRTLDIMGTLCTDLRRDKVIDASRMAPGDVIIGFSSTGQANWETRPNSGIGSNGLTMAQHELLTRVYAERYPESHAPDGDLDLNYCGRFMLESALFGDERFTVGEALLSPTRTYAPLIRFLLQHMPVTHIHGLIHCTGGGQTKIRKFGAPGAPRGLRFVKDRLFPVPPIFALIQAESKADWRDMYKTFNMGHRLEAVVPKKWVQLCLEAARECGIEARVIGRVERRRHPGNEVVLHTPHGTFTYDR